jgi:hypothetical protein
MRRVALTSPQIAALPDNYQMALTAHSFPDRYDETSPFSPFLPPDLLEPSSTWVNVGNKSSIGAISHVQSQAFNGRSVFYIFYRVPAGRQSALDFITALNVATTTGRVPPVPENTHVALVRQLLLIDVDGAIVPTSITKSIQLRVLHQTGPQNVYEFNLERQRLFEGQTGGLYAVKQTDKEFPLFMGHGLDPFERHHIPIRQQEVITLQQCGNACHFNDGASGIISYSRSPFPLPSNVKPTLISTTMQIEAGNVIDWKKSQESWQLLKKTWASD